ncbi:MAG: hypothetical protein ACE366_17220 [Bradymonadia bacterium]
MSTSDITFADGDFVGEPPVGQWAGPWQIGPYIGGMLLRSRHLCRLDPELSGSWQVGLATVTSRQTVPLSDLQQRLAFRGIEGVAPLLDVAPVSTTEPLDMMVEARPAGVPSTEAQLSPAEVKTLALALLDTVYAAHKKRYVLGGIRPELVFVRREHERWVFSGIAPRCEAFISTAETLCHGALPLFEHLYLAPEMITHPSRAPTTAADIFSACATISFWMTGQYPFAGSTFIERIMSLTHGKRRPWGTHWWSAEKALAAGMNPDLNTRPQAGKLKSLLRPARP